MTDIHVSAVLMRDAAGRVLTVRKTGTTKFMLPGGKPQGAESSAQTAAREFEEELGVPLNPGNLAFVGEFRAAAANETGRDVVAQVFTHPYVDGVYARAEIDAVQWVDPRGKHPHQAPLNTEHVFPLLHASRRVTEFKLSQDIPSNGV